ncbi:E3 SUMO-protein ligase SIZ1 [Citrus sinensis]|uniref:E3 SUMO-protein ligase SIZ1 n=1 Tax=Citrus sinensis TaxID=2711 RepID=A0ACB8IV68_CITSI|nr:E3 SUMO-protein ligase SIZ1 [Citrus sinensis]
MWAKKSPVSKEEVAKLVDDTHRKLQVSVAPDLASKGGQGVSNSSNIKIKGEMDDYIQSDTKVCCPCGSSLETESMIKCEDPRCPVWQHMSCVIIPEKPTEGNPPVPELFYCEICRLSRADPTNPARILEKTFPITRADKDLLSKQEYDVQAWCMLLNDKVPFRMQWPQYADLQVNGVPVRAINRPGSQLLGANGRDDGPIITPWTKDGINKIVLTGCDARIFCLGVRIVKRRSVQQVLNLIPKESEGEHFEDALTRVCRCVGGGNAADNADSDSDLEVVADSIGVNLRCPWQCPICLRNYSLENIIIDPYFNRITSKMRNCGEDITELEVKPDGSWRVKTRSESDRREIGDLASWHFPDGSLCAPAGGEDKPKVEMLKHVKQEGVSEGHIGLKLGIRKNRNGLWEVSKPEDMNGSSGSRLQEKFENHDLKVIPMSSSATGSGRDGEDASVNQDVGGTFDFTNNGIEHDSMSLNVDPTYAFADRNPCAPVGNAEVIVLSDSEDENDLFISSENIYRDNRNDVGGVSFSVPSAGIANSYPEDPAIGAGGDSCLGYLASNDNDFGMPLWPLPSGTQGGPGFQLFSPDVDVPDGFMDLQHGSINCSTPMNGYTLAPDTSMGSASLVPGCTVGAAADMSDALVDNPLAFDREDPSLQIFLPTRPSDTSVQTELRDQADVANGIRTEDWISLRLGDGVTGGQNELAAANGLNSKQPVHSRESAMDSLADTASLLLGMNEGRSEKASRQRSDSPFSFPRQKRSAFSLSGLLLSPSRSRRKWTNIMDLVKCSMWCEKYTATPS